MCGICGVIRFDSKPVQRESLIAACAALHHRGPDGRGEWIEPPQSDPNSFSINSATSPHSGNVGLAAARLAVLDPSHSADQPMHRGGRYTLVYNGELYNYRELRDELRGLGESFATQGDTEVVLSACARWGVRALPRFNGMWALAFYDSREKKGFLSRDPFGIKPLLYVADPHALRFASEMRSLELLDDWNKEIAASSVVDLLMFGFIGHPASIYSAARKLPPGNHLEFDAAGAAKPVCYYSVGIETNLDTNDYSECRTLLRRRIADAVTARKVAHVPIGAFLSGGIDSTIVAHHLVEAMGLGVKTFSLGYMDARRFDESSYARLAARHIGAEHHEIMLSERELIDALPAVLDHLSEPFGDSSILPTALLSSFTRRHVTVSLSGDAGDELFGGYWRYLGHETLAAFSSLPAPLRAVLRRIIAGEGRSRTLGFGDRARQFRKLLHAANQPDPFSRHLMWSRILAPDAEKIFIDRQLIAESLRRRHEHRNQLQETNASQNGSLNELFHYDLYSSLPDDMLHKVDAASMMHSLEVRVPFLDARIVELALSMPAEFKIYKGTRKRILIDAYRGILPDEILDRPKKGFEVPIANLIRGPLRSLVRDTIRKETLDSFGLFSFPDIEMLLDEHEASRADHSAVLFAMLSLCRWRHASNRR